MTIHFSHLEKITGGTLLQLGQDDVVRILCIDSRKASAAEGTLFFAIKGERHDGHQYVGTLYAAGVRNFVLEQPVDIDGFPDASILLVPSSIVALQQLASFHRRQFSLPVIGITGSNAKTTIKEWLYQMLSKDKITIKSPGSYNSQIGVPLSVWQIQSHHTLGIFEAGISRPGEMRQLKDVMLPTIGIFTNIGTAHDEGFRTTTEKISEKLILFEDVGTLIYCCDQEAVHAIITGSGIPSLSWGSGSSAAIRVSFDARLCTYQYKNVQYKLELPFADNASRENCLHCVAAMLHLGYDASTIQSRVTGLRSIPMRMELKEGINYCQLIDDSYNNDLGGLEIALQFLANQHQKQLKRVVLSDILESGMAPEALAKRIASLIRQFNIQRFVGIGPVLSRYREFFPPSSEFYNTTEDFLVQFDFGQLSQEIILIKGARAYAFEKIVSRLQRKVHGTVLEIDLNAIVYNLNFFKSKLSNATKVMAMVKAFAYGSGSAEIANLLQYHRVDYLGVAYADEGLELRKNHINLPIMVMNPSEESFDAIIANALEPEVYSLGILRSLCSFLEGRPCNIHLKLDTGMHRLGFDREDLPEALNILNSSTNIKVVSIFSHLAGADDPRHDAFSKQQLRRFMEGADYLTAGLGYKPLYHILNSPGILRLPEMHLDMVRLGIGLYGIDPTVEGSYPLKPVATLRSVVSQVKQIKQGESIGYGRKGVAEKDARIAVIAIGYADGYSRALSNGVGEVLVHGKRAKVIGNVCMDMTMVDVTGIHVNEGDEVILYGKDFPIHKIAESIHTIPYEVLTNTSERVKRVFISDGI